MICGREDEVVPRTSPIHAVHSCPLIVGRNATAPGYVREQAPADPEHCMQRWVLKTKNRETKQCKVLHCMIWGTSGPRPFGFERRS